jgi:O-antigen ligase
MAAKATSLQSISLSPGGRGIAASEDSPFNPVQIGAAVALSLLGGLAVAVIGDPIIIAALFVGALFVLVGMVAPALFLSVLLLVRPLLDGPAGGDLGGVPSANAAGAIGIVLVGIAAVSLSGGPRLVDPRVTLALFGLLVVSALASVQAFFELGAAIGVEPLAELARIGALLAIYLLAGRLFGDEPGVRRLFLLVALSAAIPSLVGVYQLLSGVEPLAGYEIARIDGTFGGPIPFSVFLAVAALILTQIPRDLLDNRIRLVLLAVSLIALVGTYSRAGWLIFLVGLVMLEWQRHKAVLLSAAAICALLVLTIPNVQQRVIPEGGDTADRNAAESSFDWRLANWGGLLDKYQERPLTGWGLRSTGDINPRAPVNAGPGGGYDAHNTSVRALVEGGPLLLAAYLALYAVLLVTLRRSAREDWPLQVFSRVLLVIWVAVGAVALVADDPFEATATMYALLALTGAVQGAYGAWIAGIRDRTGDPIRDSQPQ